MLTFAAIGVFCVGLFSLLSGRYYLGKRRVLVGREARLCGLLLSVPIPLAFALTIVGGMVVMVVRGNADVDKAFEEQLNLIFAWTLIPAMVVFYVWAHRRSERAYDTQLAAESARLASTSH